MHLLYLYLLTMQYTQLASRLQVRCLRFRENPYSLRLSLARFRPNVSGRTFPADTVRLLQLIVRNGEAMLIFVCGINPHCYLVFYCQMKPTAFRSLRLNKAAGQGVVLPMQLIGLVLNCLLLCDHVGNFDRAYLWLCIVRRRFVQWES